VNQKAAALKYDELNDRAPKLVAKGVGAVALRIMEKAKEFDIPIFKNEALANSLIGLEVDENIPPELYKAVVEVFVWLNKVEKKAQLSS